MLQKSSIGTKEKRYERKTNSDENLSPRWGFKKNYNFFLPTLNAYGINVRLLLVPLGAQGL